MKEKIKSVSAKLKKASKAHAKQAKVLDGVVNAENGGYIGSYISGDLAGKKVSNPSYRKYYKGLLQKALMASLESVIIRINRFLEKRIQDLSVNITSGGVDNMESYKYIIGQINAYEATKQELSNLLNDKEQNDSKGTIGDINTRNT